METVKPELVKRIATNIADLREALAAGHQSINETTAGMERMVRTYRDGERQEQAKAWAQRIRRLEPQAMAWIYEGEGATVDLARRTLAQTVGLRRLLDQLAGRTSRHGEE